MWNARKYIKIDTFYASSQLCSVCGYQNPDTKDLSVRTWICPKCGAEHDKTTRLMLKLKFDGVIDMKIREVNENKKQFIALLLLADEQENMIDHYLEKGTMYVLEDGNVKAECVVTDEDNGILEIKNIAVDPENQGKGYGKALIDFLASKYADEYSILQVGTGDSPLTVPFYEKCGFVRSHNIPNFFTDNYDHPIYECGVQLIDMVYLQRCSEENKLMNILVLNGSPHVNANTMAMVNAFADGAREKNHDIQTVQVMKITINSF